MKNFFFVICFLLLTISSLFAETVVNNTIYPADYKFESYLPLLVNKRVAIFTNNASQINGKNIAQVLPEKNINIVKIFTPEHGFSVLSDAGASVTNSSLDNIPIISLYGTKEYPTKLDLNDIDIVLFDIQDVGVRYYTYISSLQRLMEALADANIPLIILDRPNPNAYYVDGPVLDKKYKSFVGLQEIPLVYGMTIGEYANMLVGEKWLDIPRRSYKNLSITVIQMDNYTHGTIYAPTIAPSPNLPNLNAIYWYPSLGWFEGTKMSVGRGTAIPFQALGSPILESKIFSFTPKAMIGALNPPLVNQKCYGWNFSMSPSEAKAIINGKIQLSYLIQSYQKYPNKNEFFTSFFDKLAGNNQLKAQIINNVSESEIRASWQNDLNNFKKIRNKYLLYPI